jgi:hypothetical protein
MDSIVATQPPVLSTSSQSTLDSQITVESQSVFRSLSNATLQDFLDYFEIEATVNEIKKGCYQRVRCKFPAHQQPLIIRFR